jgi:cyclophilin family peptidyl-prolyl cis-trans isomerase
MRWSRWFGRSASPRRAKHAQTPRFFRSLVEELQQRELLSVSANFPSLGTTYSLNQRDLYIPLTPGSGATSVAYHLGTQSNSSFHAEILAGNPTIDITVSGNGYSNQHITLQLFKNVAPKTVAHFVELVKAGTFTNESFYRIFTAAAGKNGLQFAQGGSGGTGANIDDEFNVHAMYNSPGLIGLGRGNNNDTGSSEFFITDPAAAPALSSKNALQDFNFRYTIFGQVTSGFETLQKILATPVVQSGKKSTPATPITINSVNVIQDHRNAVLYVSRTGTAAATDTFTVTADDGGTAQSKQITINAVKPIGSQQPFLKPIPPTQTSIEGAAISFQLEAVNLSGVPSRFIVTDANNFGSAPANVTVKVNSSTGEVTLTPKAGFTGVVNLLAGVSKATSPNDRGLYDTQAFKFVVNGVTLSPTALPGGRPNVAYSATITAANGTGTLALSVTDVQGTIAGLTIPTSGTGNIKITGTPTTTGTITFKVTATDTQVGTTTKTYRLVIANRPEAPTTVALDSSSAVHGNYTTDGTPKLTVDATAGSKVAFLVNGKTVQATEGTAGKFSATLPAGMLVVGTNSITATATDSSGNASDASTALSIVYAPSFQYAYTMPGSLGAAQNRSMNFVRNGWYDNEVGYYVVDDETGKVGGIAPGQAGYAQAVLASASRKILIPNTTSGALSGTVTANGGQRLGFYLVQDDSSADFLAQNPTNDLHGGPLMFFSFDAANPDGIRHVRSVGDGSTGFVQYAFEDLTGGGDRDFNDAVVTISAAGDGSTAASLGVLRAPGATGGTATTPTFTAGGIATGTKNIPGEFGIYYVDDVSGKIGNVAPGSAGYAKAALGRAHSVFTSSATAGATKSLSVPAGQFYGFYTIVGGTVAQFLGTGANKPSAIFSIDAANTGARNQFRWYGVEEVAQDLPTIGAADELKLHVRTNLTGDGGFDAFNVRVNPGA